MRNLIIASVLLFSTAAHAEFKVEKIIICDSTEKVFKYFTSEPHNETLMWMGKDLNDPTIQHSLLVNHKTSTWTMIMSNDKVGCVLGAGTKHALVTSNLGDPS